MSDSWQLGIKLFASVREAIGSDTVAVEVSAGTRVEELLQRLAADYPEIGRRAGALAVAVNHEIAAPSRALIEGDEVALIPPVGGG